MAQIIAVVSVGILLALSAFVWNWGSPTQDGGAVSPRLTIEDVMQKVDAEALPKQQIQDRTVVFPTGTINKRTWRAQSLTMTMGRRAAELPAFVGHSKFVSPREAQLFDSKYRTFSLGIGTRA